MVLYTELLPHHLLIAAVGDKVLTAETGGFTLWEKRLEVNNVEHNWFAFKFNEEEVLEVNSQLTCKGSQVSLCIGDRYAHVLGSYKYVPFAL